MSKVAECVRSVANWSHVEKQHLFDSPEFKVKTFREDLALASPKLEMLLNNIAQIDEADMKKEGRLYKHMIFTDIKNAQYGAKIVGSGLIAQGFHHIYNKQFELDDKTYKNKKVESKNFAVICSTTIFGKPLGVKFRKQLLDLFNKRPENMEGKLLRILILDKGFKEGIDLFDVKYVHLFEPLISLSDERQAIGRATRYCGQKGLPFDPVLGWQLQVFKYDVNIATISSSKDVATMHQLFMNESGIDVRRLNFAKELQLIAREAAVDAELTAPVHAFNVLDVSPPIVHIAQNSAMPYAKNRAQTRTVKTVGGSSVASTTLSVGRPKAPSSKMNFEKMREFIRSRYMLFKWPEAYLENQCVPLDEVEGGSTNPAFLQLNPTQNFLRYYFDPRSAYKGILTWHSVGTGKTCTAIATATTGFEAKGYTILWVTRHTLKTDVYKNLFDKICSMSLRMKIKRGYQLPPNASEKPRKYLGQNWFLPISYKQFSNALAGKNSLYQKLVERNGSEDILRNTLLIIDEAHKLYAPDVIGSEKPNTPLITEKIKESYEKSKKESVRVMLMTGTPYTNDPLHLMKLLNLLRDPQTDTLLPETFEEFQAAYLTNAGTFSKEGADKFKDDVSGYISYLNREKDARQFAYPVFHDRLVDVSQSDAERQRQLMYVQQSMIADWEQEVKEAKELKSLKAQLKDAIANEKAVCKDTHPPRSQQRKDCEEKAVHDADRKYADLIAEASQQLLLDKEAIKVAKKNIRELKKDITKSSKTDKSQEAKIASRCKLSI